MNKKSRTVCWSLNLKQSKKKILQRLIYSLHACMHTHIYTQTLIHTALNSSTNDPQWVGYKGGDVMSVMETVCPFTSDPFLIQLSLLTQRREKERQKKQMKDRKKESVRVDISFYPFPHPPPASFIRMLRSNLLLDLGYLNTLFQKVLIFVCALVHQFTYFCT